MKMRAIVTAALLGAALVTLPAVASAEGKPVGSATEGEKAAAGKAYVDAKAAYDANPKKLEEALTGFRASYDIVASPNSHLMIATVLADMGRSAEAYAEAEIVAEEGEALGGDYLNAASAARNIVTNLTPKVGLVTVELAPGANPTSLRVGGREIPRVRWAQPVAVEPGSVKVEIATATGPQSELVDVAAGATASVKVGAAAPPPPPPPEPDEPGPRGNDTLKYAGFAAAGVGVVGVIVAAGLGAANNAKFNDLKDACTGGVCPADRESDISSGKSLQAGANAMTAIGVIGLAAGAALITAGFLVDGPSEEAAADPASPERTAGARVELGLGLGTVGLSATF